MSGSRPSIFDNIDLSGFKPKTGPDPGAVPSEKSLQIAEEAGFPSRASVLRPAATARQIMTKSGRTVLLNARITQRAHDRFHQIVAAEQARYEAGEIMHRPTLGEIVERALQALEREMRGEER
jgi:hypothetical protein